MKNSLIILTVAFCSNTMASNCIWKATNHGYYPKVDQQVASFKNCERNYKQKIGKLFFARSKTGQCFIRSNTFLKTTSRDVKIWLKVSDKETYKSMNYKYTYGPTHFLSFKCPKTSKINTEFAFDFGRGKWDNNSKRNYKLSLPALK